MTEAKTRAHGRARWTAASIGQPCPRLASLVMVHATAALVVFQLVRSF